MTDAIAIAFGVMDETEHRFSGSVGGFVGVVGVAARAGAITGPIIQIKGFAVFWLNEVGAFSGGGIACCVAIRIRAVRGVAFSADTAAWSPVNITDGCPERFGTIRHEWLSFGF